MTDDETLNVNDGIVVLFLFLLSLVMGVNGVNGVNETPKNTGPNKVNWLLPAAFRASGRARATPIPIRSKRQWTNRGKTLTRCGLVADGPWRLVRRLASNSGHSYIHPLHTAIHYTVQV